MAFAAPQHFTGSTAAPRNTSVCRIHTCVRCKTSIDSHEPCSFVRTELRICGTCRGQEQALKHLASRPSNWSARLALRVA